MSASVAAETTAGEKKSRAGAIIGPRLKGFMLALVVPLALLLGWHLAVKAGMTRLIPSPADVAEYMVDFA
ncbi:MAG: ABC transporter permease, partial [Roseomonas sp.]|nr:ABC transporter permease [Roseomonas sp.]